MNPVIHYIGTPATFGWILPPPSGAVPEDYAGVQFQVLVLVPAAADIAIPAYLTGGDVMIGGEPAEDPLLMAIDLGADDLQIAPGTYRAIRRIDDGSGWRAIPAGEFYLKLRRST